MWLFLQSWSSSLANQIHYLPPSHGFLLVQVETLSREIWTVYLMLPLSLISDKNLFVLSPHRFCSWTEQPRIHDPPSRWASISEEKHGSCCLEHAYKFYQMFNCKRMFIFISNSLSFCLKYIFFLCLMKKELLYGGFFPLFFSFFSIFGHVWKICWVWVLFNVLILPAIKPALEHIASPLQG